MNAIYRGEVRRLRGGTIKVPPRCLSNRSSGRSRHARQTAWHDADGGERNMFVNEAIADEVRKDQGVTLTFPFGDRKFEEHSAAVVEEEEIREARDRTRARR
jgi:hypothetical protein